MKTTVIEPHRSSLGMQANITVLAVFIGMAVFVWIPGARWFAWVVPLAFFFLEKESKFVKFEAVQALVAGIVYSAVTIVFSIIAVIVKPRVSYNNVYDILSGRGVRGSLGAYTAVNTFTYIVCVIITLLMAYVVYQAYKYKQVELPFVGPIAHKASARLAEMNVNINVPGSFTEKKGTDAAENKNAPDDEKKEGQQ